MPPLNRREFLQSAAVVGAALGVGSSARAAARSAQPNVLFIMADDLGYADLSTYGRRDYVTPVLDRLAADGLKLSDCYANSCVCSATRTALLTGRYQYRLRVGLEEPLGGGGAHGMPPEHPTIATQFRAAGYHTALVGKWHLGEAPDFGPLKSGYDRFFGFYPGGVDYFSHRLAQGKQPVFRADVDGLYEGEQPVKRDGYLTDVLTDEAIADIRELAGTEQPFFMSLHYSAPHWPWEGPNDVRRSRDLTTILDLDGGNLAVYAEMVKSLDANVGRVLQELERLGIADNTIVVFTSDNGGERFSDVWPFVGAKGELLEGGIRVPGIVRWPAAIKPGSTSDQVVLSMDWMPTLLAAAGAAVDPRFPSDGENLLPVLLGERSHERTVFWRYKAENQAAIRDGHWKYLSLAGNEYLFDLSKDLRERANLLRSQPERAAALKASWQKWNADMLPYPEDSLSFGAKGGVMSDRY